MLVLISGLPASGKTSLAKRLSKSISAENLSTDVVRRGLLEKRTYSEEEKNAVYYSLFEKVGKLLLERKNVVIDGTFYKKELREKAAEIARKADTNIYKILCTCPDAVAKERMCSCKREKTLTEADFSVYKKIKAIFEPISGDFLEIDTMKPVKEQANSARNYIYEKEIVKFLGKKETYPHKVKNIQEIQTHISRVFLTGDFVYKVKKPVKFTFLDYSTLEKRKHFCGLELELNRRLCPEIYLEVVPLSHENAEIKFSSKNIVDYAVKMKQLPQEKKMDVLLEKNEVSKENIIEIAKVLADFHKKAEVIADKKFGSAQAVKNAIFDLQNFCEVIEKELKMGKTVDSVLEKCGSFIDSNKKLFEKRISDCRIKRCHGDVYSKNIFIADKIYVFDAIEFNDEFACIDVASEIAFFAMDLDFHGKEDFSGLFVENYIKFSCDSELKNLLNLYKCYRANVRAKVSAISLEFANGKEREKLLLDCKRYLKLCEKYAEML